MALTNLWKRIHGRRLAQGSEFELQLARKGEGVFQNCNIARSYEIRHGHQAQPLSNLLCFAIFHTFLYICSLNCLGL